MTRDEAWEIADIVYGLLEQLANGNLPGAELTFPIWRLLKIPKVSDWLEYMLEERADSESVRQVYSEVYER